MNPISFVPQRLFIGIMALALAPAIWAALGDNAPPIPSTYNTGHPRLGAPPNSWLTRLWNGGALPARYSAAAGTATTGFDPTCTRQNCDGRDFRYLLTSYLASKAAGNPNTVWKNKLIALAALNGTWGRVVISDDSASIDSSACGTYCTLTDTNVNFLTGCNGTSCAGEYLGVMGLRFAVDSVTDANHVVIRRFSTGQPYPFPNGTNVKIRVLDTLMDTGESTYYFAMLYDWMYSDFTAQQQSDIQASLANLCLQFENDFVSSRYSPYNDEFYAGANGWIGKLGMFAAAIAIYPDTGATGLAHVRWGTDVLFNVMLPVWKQVMGTGGWHESWNDYINSNANVTMKAYIVGALLPWANATGNMPGFFTVDNPWLKNFAYLTMYMAKPDFTLEKLGAVSTTVFANEYSTCAGGNQMGALNGLAEIYNDSTLRGWARLVNGECSAGPDGFEPSAWPYYAPDNAANASTDRSGLPLCHNFTGWGTVVCRSGWGEDDTWMSFRYGDNFWGHMHLDAGSFTIFNRGSLAIDSGTYHAGSGGRHYGKYATQAIAHNTLTITDPADNYPAQLIEDMTSASPNVICEALPNDGGQRRVGSGWQTYFGTPGCGAPVTNVLMESPDTLGSWYLGRDYYHEGTLISYAASPDETAPRYVYMAADVTAAYNNPALPANVSNRTQRVQKFVRHIVFIPRNHAGYFVIYDQVTSTNPSFTKKWLLHSINQPVITGSKYVIQRGENISSKPYASAWPGGFMLPLLSYANSNCGINNGCYQYGGQLTGFAVATPNYAGAPVLTSVGGAGHEFDDGTGKNQNECQYGQDCADATDAWGLGNSAAGCPVGFICPTSDAGGEEPGAWRIEEQPYSSGTSSQDWFLNVMFASNLADTDAPQAVTAPPNLPAETVGATWSDSSHSYTITFPRTGTGGHIVIDGLLDEDLLSHAQQQPYQLQIVSGNGQSGPAGAPLASPLVVAVTDSSGNPVPNSLVYYAITRGSGLLSSTAATTDASGRASVILTQGTAATGSVNAVMAAPNGIAPVEFDSTVAASSASPTLSSFSCVPTSLAPGATATCTVTLSQAAGAGGVTITFSSNSPAITIPASVSVPAGLLTQTFTAVAGTLSTGQPTIVTATLNGAAQAVAVSLVVAATVPSVPQNLTATSISSSQINLAWTPSTDNAGVTGYRVFRNGSQIATPTASNYADTGLTASTSYSYTVSAVDAAGNVSGQSSVVQATTQSGSSGGISLTNGNWTMVKTNGFPEQMVGFGKLVYATGIKEAVMLEQYHGIGSEPDEALVGYNFPANRWDVLSLGGNFHSDTNPEAGHSVGMFTYDPNNNSFLYYCCHSGSNGVEMPLRMWWFDASGQVGRNKQTPLKPGLAQEAGAAFDVAHNIYVLFDNGNTWTYDPATNKWQQVTPKGTAPPSSAGAFPSMTYDSANQKIYLFGGGGNDIYTYDVPSNTWTLVAPTGAKPSVRDENSFAYDSTNNVFLAFGGRDSNGNFLNDSWIYDPTANAWTRLSPPQSPAVTGISSFSYLTYDSDDNAFILARVGVNGYANGAWNYNAAQTWLFRYKGNGPNPGSAPTTPQPISGGINHNATAWADEPALASDGLALYAAWIETGEPFDTSDGTWPHIYAAQLSGGTWNNLGNSYLALDSEWSGSNESHAPSLTVIGGAPWVSWYKYNDPAQPAPPIYVKSWNGSSWTGGAIGPGNTAGNFVTQGDSQIIGIGRKPYIAFLENNRTICYPWCNLLYVKSWNGSSWNLVGGGPLNKNSNYAAASSVADSVSITSDGANPIVAWTEYTASDFYNETSPQLYVSKWNGSSWQALGSSINNDGSDWAYNASITYLNNQPYIAWTERSAGGNAQVFVKTFNGTSWVTVGAGTLNKDTNTGWAFQPNLVADAATGNLYLSWIEQQAVGQRAQVYVSKFTGGAWTALGTTLNADPVLGSAQRVSLAVVGGQPTVGWGEVSFGSMRQVFIKQWNGSNWAQPNGSAQSPVPSTASPCDLNGDGTVNIQDVLIAVNQVLGVLPCSTADLLQNGQCSIIDVQRIVNASLGSGCVIGH